MENLSPSPQCPGSQIHPMVLLPIPTSHLKLLRNRFKDEGEDQLNTLSW